MAITAPCPVAKVTVTAAGGMWRCNHAGFNTTLYGYFTFSALPTQAGYKYLVQFYNTSGAAVGVAVDPSSYTHHDHGIGSANWTVYSIPLSAFGSIGTVGGVSIKDNSGAASNTFYLSAVGFWGSPASGFRFAPGHYAHSRFGYHFDTQTVFDGIISDLQTLPVPFRGVSINAYYGNFDRGTSSADFSQGITNVRTVLDAALAAGKFVGLHFSEQNFTSSAFPNSPTYPTWWNSGWCKTGSVPQIYADLTQTAVVNTITAQIQAYGAAFKDHPALAWFSPFDDSSISTTNFDGTTYYANRVSLFQVARNAFPRTMIRGYWSFTNQAAAQYQALIQSCFNLGGFLLASPDPPLVGPLQSNINRDITGYRVYRGDIGTVDFRPNYRVAAEVQDIGLSVSQNNLSTPSNIFTYLTSTSQINPSFMIWQQESDGNAQTSWSAIKTYVAGLGGPNYGIRVTSPNDGFAYQLL